MSETLTYTEESSPDLTPDEQESLKIGEEMQQEQDQLLAGKYKNTEDLEKAYLELQQKLGTPEEPEAEAETTEEPAQPETTEEPENEEDVVELTQEDVDFLHDMAGGEESYQSMLKWASSNLTAKEVDMYDSVMDAGNPSAIYFAVQALVAKYGEATGTDGKLLTGGKASDAVAGFRSQAELVSAMNDPRYESDEAYRNDVLEKLERSDLNF